ncbi:MAG: polymer-forming cytoskeletal protein [Methyloceanibacter sp.]
MFASRHRGTVIAKGLKIVGSVTAEGLVEVNGHIDGELHCTSLIISRGAQVNGTVAADRIVVDGNVEGPIRGGDVILKSQAHVVGDIQHQTLTLERGAYFEGRSVHVDGPSGRQHERVDAPREISQKDREAAPAAARTG